MSEDAQATFIIYAGFGAFTLGIGCVALITWKLKAPRWVAYLAYIGFVSAFSNGAS